jgi:hypothetical protein
MSDDLSNKPIAFLLGLYGGYVLDISDGTTTEERREALDVCMSVQRELKKRDFERKKLEAAYRWIPVTEDTPKEPYTCVVKSTEVLPFCAYYLNGSWWDRHAMSRNSSRLYTITHWMRLPE